MLRLLCVFVILATCHSLELSLKTLAGPPTDFGLYTLPTPLQSADVQNSATFTVDLTPSEEANVLTQVLTLPVDSQEQYGFTFYSPAQESISLSLKNPKGQSVKLHAAQTFYPIGDLQVPGMNYKFTNPIMGDYTLTIRASITERTMYKKLASSTADAYVVLWNEDALSTHTAINTYSLLTGNQVGLVTRVFNSSFSSSDMLNGLAPQALRESIQEAEMSVILPDGAVVDSPMKDDGLSGDGDADDGIYGALITASAPGQYLFSANVQGTNNGVNYVRTTQQLVTVVDKTLTLLGSAVASLPDQTRMNIFIGVNAPVNNKYKAYAEVWGKDKTGNDVAIAWIGGMAVVQASATGLNSLALELDLNWISRANAQDPLTLKNVAIQDPGTFVPIDQSAEIPLTTTFSLTKVMASIKDKLVAVNGPITNEMLEGRMPASLKAQLNASAADASIVLVHGYCAKANPFSVYASDWTNAKFFSNPSTNLLHDAFAQAVLSWASSFGGFSYVGHSQGGAVGLHIKNYYWSGLDLVEGGRILQSVGTPYLGSSGAGTAANLGKLFGVTCGANQDLTKDGSQLWLRGISAQNRALVNYYTTTYVQGKFFGDYCNLAVNLILEWPNDGVAEYDFSQLPGGQNRGNAEGWCHSVNMKYTPQCENRDRNKQMNSAAARNIKN